ncbi:uncharacterized protein LOC111073604 [Drosophila obscura]|uniref:uncharacterized protein LOC111073604 n=1 Tax=Drosophila obscura TaxID=7282 RepID=UPI001BB13047|nr:uncharacterized protein LOC111073604 [Drosophila obscura]
MCIIKLRTRHFSVKEGSESGTKNQFCEGAVSEQTQKRKRSIEFKMSRRDPWNSKYQYQYEVKSYGNNDNQGQGGSHYAAIAPQPNRGQNSNSRGALCSETKYQVTVTKREFYTAPENTAQGRGAVQYGGQGGSHGPAVQQNSVVAKSNSRGARRAERAYERRAQATVDAIDRELAKDPGYHKWIAEERGEDFYY